MQRDMKVGMALGVALVGIVGALFFRRDASPEDTSPPALLGAEEIDQQISEKAKGPYIQGLDEDLGEAAPVPPPATATNATKPKAKSDDFQVPSFLTKEDEAEHKTFLSGKPASAPDPIVPTTPNPPRRETVGVPEPAPAHNRDWEPSGTGSPAAPKERPARSTAGSPEGGASRRTHTIQPGDTLSGIANRYLGSSARYREIYEANRHVLRSPDDLPEGTQLVIPEIGGKSTVARPVSTQSHDPVESLRERAPAEQTRPSRETREPAVSGASSSGGLRFAPVRRGPFSAGRSAPGQAGPSNGPAAPAEESRPTRRPQSRPQLEIDDSDPF